LTDNVVPDAVRVRIARHEDDQKAIYRLRYQVYITELNKTNVDNADHDQAWRNIKNGWKGPSTIMS
jgi:hypothetical protein